MGPNRTTVYLEAARSAVALLAEPEVAANWGRPSALAEFGVRGLAGHLAAQLFRVPEVLALPERERLSAVGDREAESDIQCVHGVAHSRDSPRRVSRSGGGSFRGREGKRDGLADNRRQILSSMP